jgi:radical SAM superfamily enzyme YgiQ (UPF0313 family)
MGPPVYRDPELIRAIARSGCFLTYVGFESLKSKNLAEVNKNFNDPSQYPEFIRLLHRNGINVYASFLIGFKDDDFDTAHATVDFLINQKVTLASFSRPCPYPGTALYDHLDQGGFLVDKSWWLRYGKLDALVRFPGKAYTGENLRSSAMQEFFSLPSILKRFFPFPLFKIPFLGHNWVIHRQLKRFKGLPII